MRGKNGAEDVEESAGFIRETKAKSRRGCTLRCALLCCCTLSLVVVVSVLVVSIHPNRGEIKKYLKDSLKQARENSKTYYDTYLANGNADMAASTREPTTPPPTMYAEMSNYSAKEKQPKYLQEILFERIPNQCDNWPQDVKERFVQRCGHWIREIGLWNQGSAPNSKGSSVYVCLDERHCNGYGDRLAGMLGAFSYALKQDRPLRVHWDGVHQLFTTSCAFPGPRMAWSKETKPAFRHPCVPESQTQCSHVLNMDCLDSGSPRVFENLHRACQLEKTCGALRREFPTTLNVADVFGCQLRSILEPSDFFLNSKVPFMEGAKSYHHLSVREVEQLMKKYYVIGIHFRLADILAFRNSKSVTLEHPHYFIPFKCAQTIQAYDEGRRIINNKNDSIVVEDAYNTKRLTQEQLNKDDLFKVNGKPVRWFLASDSAELREMAKYLFGPKLLMIALPPKHIALTRSGDHVTILRHTVAEWYLLGLSDKIVMNRIGHRGLFQGRVSAFPKTTWTYQMKHLFYDAGHCRLRSIPFDGTWRDGGSVNMQCTKSKILKHSKTNELLPQDHLHHLDELGKEFDGGVYWIDRNEVKMSTSAGKLTEGEEDEENEEENST